MYLLDLFLEFSTVERTLLTYRKSYFTQKLKTLGENKGHFVIPEFNFDIAKWLLFLPKLYSF